jgi:hypothetical protein
MPQVSPLDGAERLPIEFLRTTARCIALHAFVPLLAVMATAALIHERLAGIPATCSPKSGPS